MEELIEILHKIPLFAALPDKAVAELASKLERQSLETGEVLFRKGDPGDALYIIQSGFVKIVIPDEHGKERVVAERGPGDALGLVTLMDQDPRTAGVVALSPSEMLVLKRDVFADVIGKLPDEVMDDLRQATERLRLSYVDILREIPLFASFPDQAIAALIGRLESQNLEEGEVLFRKGDLGDTLYIIERGWVKIVTEGGQGEELVLNQCGPGEALGEMSLIDQEPRSVGVIALTPVEMLKLDRESFMGVLHDYPEVSLSIMRKLVGRLRFNTIYIERAIELSRCIAEGDYSFVVDQIQGSQAQVAGEDLSDEARANELLSAFFAMVRGVQEREEELKQEVRRLTIQIDEARRQAEVESLTQSEFFADLRAAARRMREEDENTDKDESDI